jgi:hypothetical protein
MKQKKLSTVTVNFIIFLSIFALNCSTTQKADKNNDNRLVQNLTGDQISRLENGVLVRFPATLLKRVESNCVELFAQDDFKKYNGDSKHAIISKLVFEPLQLDLRESKVAVVTGKMVSVRDANDTSETCGIVTGKIFEITDIEYF